MPRRPSRCVILVPVERALDPGCEDGLRELERRGYPVWRVHGYSAIDAARNQMANDALAQGFDELMWIDADIVFDPDDVERISQVDPKPGGGVLDATAYVLRVLSQNRRGRPAAARQALAQAQAIRDRHWPQIERGRYFDDDWHDWLRFDVLRRETEQPAGAGPKPP